VRREMKDLATFRFRVLEMHNAGQTDLQIAKALGCTHGKVMGTMQFLQSDPRWCAGVAPYPGREFHAIRRHTADMPPDAAAIYDELYRLSRRMKKAA
jgi:hypothetical protein